MTYNGKIDIIGEGNHKYYKGDSSGGKHRDMHGNDVAVPAGERVHYHKVRLALPLTLLTSPQGLAAGENTANLKIVQRLLELVVERRENNEYPAYEPEVRHH